MRRSLTNTNCIESMISTMRGVKRWIATGMIEAQRSFRRVRGHNQMPDLVTAIANTVNPVTVTPRDYPEVA